MPRPNLCIPALLVSTLTLGAQTAVAVLPLSPQQLEIALKSGKLLIVEFGGEHCIPCRKMQPILQEIQKGLGEKGSVHNFWIADHPEIAKQYKVMLMPTQIVFDPKGREILRHQGLWELAAFQQALRDKGVL